MRACKFSGSVKPPIFIPGTAALARSLICTIQLCFQLRWTPLQVLVFRRDLRDHLRHFTPLELVADVVGLVSHMPSPRLVTADLRDAHQVQSRDLDKFRT